MKLRPSRMIDKMAELGAAGVTRRQIAEALGLNLSTVRHYCGTLGLATQDGRTTDASRAAARARMLAVRADPEAMARQRENAAAAVRSREFREKIRQKALARWADPAFNPLVGLTPEQRADYDTLRRVGRLSRDEALAKVLAPRTKPADGIGSYDE